MDQDTIAFIQSLAAIVAAAQNALLDPTISRQQAAAERQAIQYASAVMLLVQQTATPESSPARVVVQTTTTIFGVAQQQLGSALNYKLIQQANNLVGLDLSAIPELVIPNPQ